MTATTATGPTAVAKRVRWKRLLGFGLVILVIGAFADLLGWDITGWLGDVWDTITSISGASLVAATVLKTLQTTATAYAWYSILKYAYPTSRFRLVLACYATSVALNSILPANIGTLVMLVMFTTIIAGATFSSVLGAYVVEKIFFTLSGAFTYLYLFLRVGGSFDIKFHFVNDHPATLILLLAGAAWLIYLVIRAFWPRVVKWWDEAKAGGQILTRPSRYFSRVFVPSFVAWIASLGVMAVFLHAYDIPVTFDTLMRIAGGNSIANMTSVTPGGAGVNQAFNVASLNGVTTSANATAYSVAQQLFTTALNIVFAIILVTWAFGWRGGKELVQQSYADAKERAADQKAAHDARKEEKKARRAAGTA
jgi:uncharacterized membrane protein YbhN (UPF0104 family)